MMAFPTAIPSLAPGRRLAQGAEVHLDEALSRLCLQPLPGWSREVAGCLCGGFLAIWATHAEGEDADGRHLVCFVGSPRPDVEAFIIENPVFEVNGRNTFKINAANAGVYRLTCISRRLKITGVRGRVTYVK